jgi:hypothetical protein
VIVACDLEGRSRKEAARVLGLAEGTVCSRLTRGHRLLAKRLSRHGLPLSGGVLAAALSEATASGPLPAGKGGGGRPATELDVLKQEVELLKLKLEVVQEKLRSQELELRALRGSDGAVGKSEADIKREIETLKSDLSLWGERAAWSKRMSQPGRQYVTTAQAEADEPS